MRTNMYRLLILAAALAVFLAVGSCKEAQITGGGYSEIAVRDGTYTGLFSSFPNSTEVEITIRGQKITDIKILHHGAWRGRKAENVIVKRILDAQSTRVDTVTGATNSSIVIMNAVDNAVKKSMRK